MYKDDLVSTLLGIDEEVALTLGVLSPKPILVIVGGAAFMLRDLTNRSVTHDVDLLHCDDVVRQIISRYPNVNESVGAYCDQIPYNFEDRLVLLNIGSKAIDFMTPSTEDMIVMKLYAERPNDIQDIDAAARDGLVDWCVLDRLVQDPDEARAAALSSRRYKEMVGAYERYRKRWER